jgi:Uma2 family endonuclease
VTETAQRRMTVEEFLAWDDGTDTRYELVDGVPVAMAPPAGAHGRIVVNTAALLSVHLRRRPPCQAEAEAGIRISDHVRWQADLAVTCAPPAPNIDEPLLVVEVLSPSTRAKDLDRKLRDYKGLPSVREIWLVDSEARWVQVWQRGPDGWAGRDHIGGGSFHSAVLEEAVVLDELYLNTGL